MRRVPELDGLRGLAILLVVASHAFGPGMDRFGSTGVTIFFVLSGYLITGILRDELDRTGRIDIVCFLQRRARRLLPALVVTVVVVAALSVALPGDRWWSWSYLAPVLLYYGNWWWLANSPLGTLSHTWSLAVEEQFYLVWPLVVVALRRWFVPFVALLACGSLALRLAWADETILLYAATPTAGFALLVGALVARVPAIPAWVGLLAVMGVAASLLLVPMALFDALALPGVSAVAAALILSRPSWLAVRWLQWLGWRSYGLYLIHLPVIVALRWYADAPVWVCWAVGVPVSLALAELSWRYVESRWLRRGASRDRNTPDLGTRAPGTSEPQTARAVQARPSQGR